MLILYLLYLLDKPKDLLNELFKNNVALQVTYIRESHEYLKQSKSAVLEAQKAVNQAQLKARALDQQVKFLTEEKLELQRDLEAQLQQTRDKLIAVISYQKNQLYKKKQQIVDALVAKEKALALAALTVNTPAFYVTSKPRAKKPVDTATRTPTPAVSLPSKSLQLSEQLSNSKKFNSD